MVSTIRPALGKVTLWQTEKGLEGVGKPIKNDEELT